MSRDITRQKLLSYLPFQPTEDQLTAINHLSAFDASNKQNPVYMLKGYAGTGKTTLISAYVKLLQSTGKPFVLLAPTGRAAKVLTNYTDEKASTIHRQIYHIFTSPDGVSRIILAPTLLKNCVFIIDESSMINDHSGGQDSLFGSRSLLDDLMSYVFAGEKNKMLLVGDTAQLPPVGLDISPALNYEYIKSSFDVTVHAFEMKKVMRQSLDSGVLLSATHLRNQISGYSSDIPFFSETSFKGDVIRIDNGGDLEDLLSQTFSGKDFEHGIVVCRSNKRANLFNQQVRNRILQYENQIEGGDYLMVVKNNYYWLPEDSPAGFVANGDLIRIVRILQIEEMYGFLFATAEIALLDYPDEKEIEVKLLLDTLTSDGPNLGFEEQQKLYERVEEDYMDIPEKSKRARKVKQNEWLNALQVKFAYAMTCHKTQGGQWPMVIIDQGFLTDEMVNTEYLRWLYTAVTRSTDKVYLVNFNEEFFGS